MKALAMTCGLVLVYLAVIAIAVFGFDDRRTLVSPPAAVAENFFRALQCHRFPQAHKHLSSAARARVSVDALAAATARLESGVGRIEDVRGEDGAMTLEEAEGVAFLRTSGGETRIALRLHRETGEWRVTGIEGLAP